MTAVVGLSGTLANVVWRHAPRAAAVLRSLFVTWPAAGRSRFAPCGP